MSNQREIGEVLEPKDELQVFRLGGLLDGSEVGPNGRVVANSSNSKIAMFELSSGQSSPELRAQPDCEQILFVLDGECVLSCESGEHRLGKDQGFLVPAGDRYTVSNPGSARVALMWMRTAAPPEDQVENRPSNLRMRVPKEEISAPGLGRPGLGRHVYLYALSQRLIGVTFLLLADWNDKSLVRMHAAIEEIGEDIWITIPQRFVQWYGLKQFGDGDYRFLPDESGDKTRGRVELIR